MKFPVNFGIVLGVVFIATVVEIGVTSPWAFALGAFIGWALLEITARALGDA